MNTTIKKEDVGLLFIRVMLGIVFIFHGSQKLFGLFGGYGIEGTAGWMGSIGIPFPTVNAILAGGTEFFGGLLLITGIMARLAAIPLMFTMLVASFVAHGSAFDIQKGGMEYPLTLAVVLLGLALIGPGNIALSCCKGKSCTITKEA
jgi:putative oxidoreductase